MAERLERYRASSLGELLQAQQAAAGGHRQPRRSGAAARRHRASCRARTAPRDDAGDQLERAGADPFAGVDPGVRALVDRLRAHVLAGKGAYVPKGFEEAVRVPAAPDGERGAACRAARPIYGEDGAVAGAAIVLQDVTRLFRFDELKNDLVATVAHEFRTPLTSLRMALHLCTEEAVGPLTPKQADLLFAAREDCERLQVIVDELLDLSRIQSGTIELHRRRTDPARSVDMAIEPHRAAPSRPGRRSAPRCSPACRRCSSIPTACSSCSRTC